jgi:uncharacterized protein (TIGR02466 family)
MEAFAYFPAVIYRDERPDLVGRLIDVSKEQLDLVRQDGVPIAQSVHLANNLAFREVADYLLVTSVNMLRDQGYLVDKYDFYLQGLWAQEVKKGGSTNVHVHKNSQICGWFFLQTPENGAYPIYHDCRMNKGMVELDFEQGSEISNATNMVNFNNVVPGTVLFSNSWMNHQLVSGNSEQPTICIHFIISHRGRLCSTC